MRVDYRLLRDGNLENVISEWVCLEHEGFARKKAISWWQSRSLAPVPDTVDEALDVSNSIAVPRSITAIREGRFWRIVKAEIEELPTDWDRVYEEEELPF